VLRGRERQPAAADKDIGWPDRFLNMLQVFKPTSPMSVGSWLLAATGGAQSAATTCELLAVLPRVEAGAPACSGMLGPAPATARKRLHGRLDLTLPRAVE
jgi:hypothetical protein